MGFPFFVQGNEAKSGRSRPPLRFLREACILQLISYND